MEGTSAVILKTLPRVLLGRTVVTKYLITCAQADTGVQVADSAGERINSNIERVPSTHHLRCLSPTQRKTCGPSVPCAPPKKRPCLPLSRILVPPNHWLFSSLVPGGRSSFILRFLRTPAGRIWTDLDGFRPWAGIDPRLRHGRRRREGRSDRFCGEEAKAFLTEVIWDFWIG